MNYVPQGFTVQEIRPVVATDTGRLIKARGAWWGTQMALIGGVALFGAVLIYTLRKKRR